METEFTVTVKIKDTLDSYREEDIVKSIWPYCIPFFTRRHGVSKGKMILEDGAVELEWSYEDNYDVYPDEDENYYMKEEV